jgi:hypothetical protein
MNRGSTCGRLGSKPDTLLFKKPGELAAFFECVKEIDLPSAKFVVSYTCFEVKIL